MKYLLTLLSFIHLVQIEAQNLVPNPGFELFSDCPNRIGEIYKAKHWFSANSGTPEFLHEECPMNDGQPHSGKGQAGVIMFSDYSKSIEYIGTKLTKPLESGRSYCIGFWMKAESAFMYIDQIGLLLTNEKKQLKAWLPIRENAQLTTPYDIPITLELGWQMVSTLYVAQGGEQFLTIGNFVADDKHVVLYDETVLSYEPGWNSYYYVDDVLVEEVTPEKPCVVSNEFPVFDNRYLSIDEPDTLKFEFSLYFENNQFVLTPKGIDSLELYMSEWENLEILSASIKGYSSRIGNKKHNQVLSENRIQHVQEIIYSNLPLSFSEQVAYGDSRAINEDDYKDRRVDIYITAFDRKGK